jgi:hypothetical protein
MKTTFILFILLASHSLFATEMNVEFKNAPCESYLPSDDFYVVQKIDAHLYEVRFGANHVKGFLKTHQTKINSAGPIMQIAARRRAIKTFKLENGFDDAFSMLEECSLKEKNAN